MRIVGLMVATSVFVTACAEREVVLSGPREDLREDGGIGVLAVAATDTSGARPIALPAQQRLGA